MTDDWKQQADGWKDEVSSAAPVIARSEDGAIEVEMALDLTVRRITLAPRATRDLDSLESGLRDVVNDALVQARETNPINRRVQDMFGSGQEDMQKRLTEMQDDLRQRASDAETYFTSMKARMEAQRDAIQKRRR